MSVKRVANIVRSVSREHNTSYSREESGEANIFRRIGFLELSKWVTGKYAAGT